MRKRAFTLIELLTVMAITAILLTLIILPVLQSFNLTRAAQAFGDAQEKARFLTEKIAREIGDSAGVRDLSGTVSYQIGATTYNVPRHSLRVVVPRVGADGLPAGNGETDVIDLPFSKVDIIQPAQGEENIDPSKPGVYRNPVTGKLDPTLQAPKGQIVLPLVPGGTIVRYFVGLRDPSKPYNDPYSGLLLARNGERDNLYVLYRAEVPIYLADGSVNRAFFFDLGADNNPDTLGAFIDDPSFFNPASPYPNGGYVSGTGPAKEQMVANWLRRATLLTEVSRFDMIQPVYDKQSRKVRFVNGKPEILSLIQFRPSRVSSDPAAGQVAMSLGSETDNAAAVAPDIYTTQFGQWSNATVTIRTATDLNRRLVSSFTGTGAQGYESGYQIDAFDPSLSQPYAIFSQGVYERTAMGMPNSKRPAARPFTAAALDAYDIKDSSGNGGLDIDKIRGMFIPFTTAASRGRISTSFGISEVGLNALPDVVGQPANRPNLPIAATGLAQTFQQSNGAGAVYAGSGYEINSCFNRVYTENVSLRGGDVHRFIDLRVLPNEDGTLPPSYPTYIAGTVTGLFENRNGITGSRVRIVPGSEEVFGPDQLEGPNYGQAVRYTRTTKKPGPNQYRINFVDQPEPTGTDGSVDYAVRYPGFANPPAVYDPTNFVSAVLQPRYRAGYVELNSDPNVALPQGQFRVNYRFQMNGSGTGGADLVTVDYDSRQLMSVLLTIKNFAQTNLPNPQTVTLKSTATVRNYIR